MVPTGGESFTNPGLSDPEHGAGCSMEVVPVVAVDVVQPAALLHHLHGARHVLPGGEAVPPLVLLVEAGLDAAAVGALLLPAGVVVGALLRLRAAQDGTCRTSRQQFSD